MTAESRTRASLKLETVARQCVHTAHLDANHCISSSSNKLNNNPAVQPHKNCPAEKDGPTVSFVSSNYRDIPCTYSNCVVTPLFIFSPVKWSANPSNRLPLAVLVMYCFALLPCVSRVDGDFSSLNARSLCAMFSTLS